MDIITGIIIVVITVIVTLHLQKLKSKQKQKEIKSNFVNQIPTDNVKLGAHSREFDKKEVIHVSHNIHLAIGFGLANCIMIEGENGIIIIDTMESPEAAKEVLEEFRKITKKPIVGIILTHFHADHVNGIGVFLNDVEDMGNLDIIAHDSLPHFLSLVFNVRSSVTFKRAVSQFGTEIPPEVLKNAGIGLNLKLDKAQGFAYVEPTKTFSKRLSIAIAGVELELIHAPGETDDQIIVWYPKQKTLFPADNIYKAFPNLYAIRGTMHRDTLQWVAALDIMLELEAETLVPQHTRPLQGAETIREVVTAYRDAIQFVHDQTVRFMNKGLTGRQIAEVVHLPPHLRDHPYLAEHYGTVEWSVRAVYNGYIGWFSGRPGDLHPLPVRDEARLMVEMAGGRQRLVERIRKTVSGGQWQWGLKLCDMILDSEGDLETEELVTLRSKCLVELAGREVSAPGMNWYLTDDLKMRGLEVKVSEEAKVARIRSGDISSLFKMLTVMIDAEKTQRVTMTALFKFCDTQTNLRVIIRRGVCQVTNVNDEVSEEVDMKVETSEGVWREVMAKQRSAVTAGMLGELRVTPGITTLATFFEYFDTEF